MLQQRNFQRNTNLQPKMKINLNQLIRAVNNPHSELTFNFYLLLIRNVLLLILDLSTVNKIWLLEKVKNLVFFIIPKFCYVMFLFIINSSNHFITKIIDLKFSIFPKCSLCYKDRYLTATTRSDLFISFYKASKNF